MKKLYAKVIEKHTLQIKLDNLCDKINELQKQVILLEEKMDQEQEDVDRLEKISFKNLFKKAFKSNDQEIQKEKEEASIAKKNYEDALRQLQVLKVDKQYYKNKLASFNDIENKYEKLIADKMLNIKEDAKLVMYEKVVSSNLKMKEIRKAIETGETTIKMIEEMLYGLIQADEWVEVSRNPGATNVADRGRYHYLQVVEKLAKQTHKQLLNFNKELENLNMMISVNDYFHLQYYSFSKVWGVYSTVKGQLINAQISLDTTKAKVEDAIQYLKIQFVKEEKENESVNEEFIVMM